jgi:hypothetical protein
MSKYFFGPLLRILPKQTIQSSLNLLRATVRPEGWSSPKRVDGYSVGVESYPRIEEVEIEYPHEGIE